MKHYSHSFSSSSPLKTLLSFLSNLLHPIFPESLSFLILFSSNPLKTLSIVHFTPLLGPLKHNPILFSSQIQSKPCFHPSHLLLYSLSPESLSFPILLLFKYNQNLIHCSLYPTDIPFEALFSFFSSSSPLKTLLSFLSNLLHPIFPESLSFLILFSSNPLKTLSIVHFTPLLGPLKHNPILFSSSNPIKTLLSPFSSPSLLFIP